MIVLPGAESNFERLRGDEPIGFAPDACLIVRRPGSQCGVCRDACPTGVLSGGQWSITLETDGCVGCGLCAAACPTGALMVDGCTPHPVSAASERIVLECRRVAPTDRDPNAVVVPCLGGLTVPDLLDFLEQTEASVIISDHGWCAQCPVGRCHSPWQPAIDEARAALAAVDGRLADELVVERDELPVGTAMPVMAALRPDKQVGRRDFLRRMVGAVEPRDASAESRRVVFGRGLVSPLKRKRVLERIGALATDLEQPMPASLMPSVKITNRCELDGLCAAICPTGALRREEGDETLSLQFDAGRCITCGLCQTACASKALSLWPEGDGTVPHGIVTLVSRHAVACPGCGDTFIPAGDERSCPYCEKTMNLMRELASLKLGSPAPSR